MAVAPVQPAAAAGPADLEQPAALGKREQAAAWALLAVEAMGRPVVTAV